MAKKPKPAKRRRPTRPTPKPKVLKPSANRKPVAPEDISLISVKGTRGRGGGPGGQAWRIDVEGKRAGIVFINFIDEPPIGPHASIQIYLNAPSQGRKIGRVGYRKACEASPYNAVYAHMSKLNVASWRAAEEAGFVDATPTGAIQKVMIWRRTATG
jgi:hypothetical protein